MPNTPMMIEVMYFIECAALGGTTVFDSISSPL